MNNYSGDVAGWSHKIKQNTLKHLLKLKRRYWVTTIRSGFRWFQMKLNSETKVGMSHFHKTELKYIGFPYSFIGQKNEQFKRVKSIWAVFIKNILFSEKNYLVSQNSYYKLVGFEQFISFIITENVIWSCHRCVKRKQISLKKSWVVGNLRVVTSKEQINFGYCSAASQQAGSRNYLFLWDCGVLFIFFKQDKFPFSSVAKSISKKIY